MKLIGSLGLLIVSLSVSAESMEAKKDKIPHLMPDLTGREYQSYLQSSHHQEILQNNFNIEDKLAPVMRLGTRNLEWLDHINSFREEAISFTSPETTRSFPIDQPSIYNETIVFQDYESLIAQLPDAMKEILLSDNPYTDDLPIDLETYKHYGLLVDRVYQSASRWKIMQPYMWHLRSVRQNDVRGYYVFTHTEDLNEKLLNFNRLDSEEKNKLEDALLGICFNKHSDDDKCKKELESSLKNNNGDATKFYKTYFKNSEKIYESFFKIPKEAVRSDIEWSVTNPTRATIPFLNPDEKYKNFLHNIELEWQWHDWKQDWSLVLDYVDSGDNIPKLEFEAGTTPHVNELGGNEIVMDANSPLTEYEVQWTIRHEFGHVLGFEDCYIEFYDDSIQAIVNYQLDVTDLMCSRTGKLKESHFLEMKRNYYNVKKPQ